MAKNKTYRIIAAQTIYAEYYNSWKYDIYESNKSDWTKQDDKDVNEIEKLLEQQASEQKG